MGTPYTTAPRAYKQPIPVGMLLMVAKGLGMVALAVACFATARRLERS